MMKKIVYCLIIVFLVINVSAASSILGDINMDGIVNSKDYIMLRQFILNQRQLSSGSIELADLNNDKKISSADYVLIRKKILNITTNVNNNTSSNSSNSSNTSTKLSIPSDNKAYFNNTKFIKNNKETPVMAADPSIIYENGTFYLFATFGGSGVKYYSSRDMVNWEDKGYAINKQTFNGGSQSSFNAFWAPEVFKYNGKYYLIYSGGSTSDWHIQMYLAVSDRITDGWNYYSKIPLDGYANLNIDGTVLTENNRVYLYYHAKDELYGVELSRDLKTLVGTPVIVLAPRQAWASHASVGGEGPAVFKRNGKYYLMYSSNDYYTKWYAVGYATSSSPLGPFTDQTLDNPLLSSSDGPGHNSIFTIDGNNYYIVYHSIVWKSDNTFGERKLNVDQMGIDSNGRIYVNGPTKYYQPLPSGYKGKNKISSSDYSVLAGSASAAELKDNINISSNNTANYLKVSPKTNVRTYTTNNITINVSNKRIEDVWLYSNNDGFKSVTANIVINDKYTMDNVKLSDAITSKIQLPNINTNISKIKITFSKNVILSEVGLYSFYS